MPKSETATAILELCDAFRHGMADALISHEDENLAEMVGALCKSIDHASTSLGNGGANTPMGALEALGLQLEKSAEIIATGLSDVASAIREAGIK